MEHFSHFHATFLKSILGFLQWKILLLRDTSAGFFTLADMHLPLLVLGLEHGQSVRQKAKFISVSISI